MSGHTQLNPKFEALLKKMRAELDMLKQQIPVEALHERSRQRRRAKDIPMTLRDAQSGISLIAELKRASADGKPLIDPYDPVELAKLFEVSGAMVLSVATDDDIMQGSIHDLASVKDAVDIPVFRHDFIFDEYQIIESRAAGADGVRLIVGILSDQELRGLLTLTQRLGMSALLEIRTQEELDRALPLEPRLIAINRREWLSDKLDEDLPDRLRQSIPPHIVVVCEGGISTVEDVRHLIKLDVDAFIVGEALLTAADSGAKIWELTSL